MTISTIENFMNKELKEPLKKEAEIFGKKYGGVMEKLANETEEWESKLEKLGKLHREGMGFACDIRYLKDFIAKEKAKSKQETLDLCIKAVEEKCPWIKNNRCENDTCWHKEAVKIINTIRKL